MPQVSQSLAQQFRTDGVVCLPGAVDAETLNFLEDGFNWSVSNPSPSASNGDALIYYLDQDILYD